MERVQNRTMRKIIIRLLALLAASCGPAALPGTRLFRHLGQPILKEETKPAWQKNSKLAIT
jgi:hypothetical protein